MDKLNYFLPDDTFFFFNKRKTKHTVLHLLIYYHFCFTSFLPVYISSHMSYEKVPAGMVATPWFSLHFLLGILGKHEQVPSMFFKLWIQDLTV